MAFFEKILPFYRFYHYFFHFIYKMYFYKKNRKWAKKAVNGKNG